MLFYVFESILFWNWIVFMPENEGTAYFQAQWTGSAKELEKIYLQKMKAKVSDGDTFDADLNPTVQFSNP